MDIEVSRQGSTWMVMVPASVDGDAAAEVEAVLRRLIGDGARSIMANFSRTRTVSADGAAMFTAVLKDLHRLEGKMAFCLMAPGVREVFAAAGVTNLYRYYDQGEALQVDVLRELSAHFDEYEDFHAIRLRREGDRLFIEIFLEFDGERKMGEVQKSIDRIKANLEAKIKGSEVLIIPTAGDRNPAWRGGDRHDC